MTLAKHKVPEPHIKVKDAAEYFVNTPGASLAGAAKYCGVSVPRMRELLQMPHNLNYVRQVKTLAIEVAADDEALDALPEPARVTVKSARRKSPGATKAR